MLSALIFSPDAAASKAIESLALESNEVRIYRTMDAFPSPYELTRLVSTFSPDIIFLELNPLEGALSLARHIRALSRDTAVLGFGRYSDEVQAERASDAGVQEILSSPLTCRGLQDSLAAAIRKARPAVQENLLAFLPSKAGSGSTTVAVSVAGRLVHDLRQKVLVIEADLHSGILSVLLKFKPECSLADALDNTEKLEGLLWSRMVSKAHGLDFLAAPRPKKATMFSWVAYHQLLRFAGPLYDTVIADLPEVVNDATVEIVRRARQVFIVGTTEIPSLILAGQRLQELRNRGIPENRIGVILNRWKGQDLNPEDVEQFLREPVLATFPNDYPSVRRAILEGRLLKSDCKLGKSFSSFAAKLAARAALPPAA